jgi:D-arabinose 1-dehydrogenase-like Zn-dependent alcohol dehydrogenase
MVLNRPGQHLEMQALPEPSPGKGQVLIRVAACGVCRTDLHVVDGELSEAKLQIIPGHEIVDAVAGHGPGAERFAIGDRVGVPWLGQTCGRCRYCLRGRRTFAMRLASRATRSMVVMRSVANLTRRDGDEFLAIAPQIPVRTEIQSFPLEAANDVLDRLRDGRLSGAAVLLP